MNSTTQEMKFRQALMKYADKYGVTRAARKYNKCRSYIYFWQKRWDGTVESLKEHSKRPHHHPNEHTPEELKLIRDMRRRNPKLGLMELWHRLCKRGYTRRPESLYRVLKRLALLPPAAAKPTYKPKPYEQMTHPGERVQIDVKFVPLKCLANKERKLYQYTAIDEFTRLRFIYGYEEHSTYSSADFLKRAVEWYKRRGIIIECVQTDNGPEFTTRFIQGLKDKPTLFQTTAEKLGIRHKLIRPYTPRHNGKVERSHREDHNKFYSCHSFYSCDDFNKQLKVHLARSNNRPMRPLNFLSPLEFLSNFRVQYH
jgi:transposase InsO family protein